MKQEHKKALQNATRELEEAKSATEAVLTDAQGLFDDMSEKAQEGDAGTKLQEEIEHLETAVEALDNAIEAISDAQGA